MTQLPSIRLRPTESAQLTTQAYDSGAVFYDAGKNTLVVMDGRFKGGYELLRADLSNITGGSGGTGTVDFGARVITAQSFVGDGSLLTNLPIPPGSASITYVNNKFNTIASTTVLGTVKVDGTTITINPSTGVISSNGGGGGGGVDLTAFSVGTPNAASANGAISYDNTTGVFTYTPPNLSTYLTSYTETSTLNAVVTRGGTTNQPVTINNTLTVDDVSAGTGSIGTLTATTGTITTLTATNINTSNIINSGTGVPRWTSGSDFIIDAAGDINVVGSKITNLATPTRSNDAATKSYVDGAASAFAGGTVAGAIYISNATASTGPTTGALRVQGGAGIVGDLWAGGIVYSGGSPVLTSESGGYNGGIISGTIFVNNNTASTTSNTGALRVLGGVGIQGTLNTGPDAFFNGIRFGRGSASSLGSNTNLAAGGGTANDAPLAVISTGTNNVAVGFKSASSISSASFNVAVGSNAMSLRGGGNNNVAVGYAALTSGSTSSNTAVGSGAMGTALGDNSVAVGHDSLLQSAGTGNIGIGYIAGNAIATGDYNVIIGSNTGSTIDGTSNNVLICDGAGNVKISASGVNGDVKITSTTASTNATSGSLQVGGGLGVSGAINATGIVKFTNGTVSTSTLTGSLQVTGGVGINGDVYATNYFGNGSNLTGVTASGYSGGTVSGATSFTFTGANSASTSTTTGAVKISAGLGVQGAVWASNFNGATVPSSGSVPGANGLVRTDGNGWSYTNYINSNTADSEAVSPTQVIITASDNFYRKVNFSRLNSGHRGQTNITGGGLITFNASSSILWASRFIVISGGFGAAFSTAGYFDINCPTSGTITGVGGHANVTATAAGITLGLWDALYYILPVGSTATSLAANFRIATYTGALDIPYNWVLLGVYNGDSSTLYMPNGVQLKAGQSVDVSVGQNKQFNSLGIGTTASGTAGEIRATNEITAYYSSDKNLKENIVPIENALGKLRQITGVMFDWTDEEIAKRGGEDGYFVRKHDTGVIAQDVEPQLPEVVATREDGTKAVKYEKLAGLIIQAINELADQVDELKKKVS
jgi:hypothetical protein